MSLLWYVLTKVLFNQFAVVSLPMDMWSNIDVLTAITNMVTLSFMATIKGQDIMSQNKQGFNVMIVLMIVSTWMRLIGYCFVMESFSKLIVTIIEMLKSATTFLAIVLLYLIVVSSISICLYQESSISYSTFINAIRTMYDAMMGMY